MAVIENKTTCCKIETGALMYGIFNILVTAPASIVGIVIMISFFCNYTESYVKIYIILVGVFMVAPCVLVLLFNIMLVWGVCKKAPCPVMAHFVFGIIFAIVALGSSLYTMNDGYSEEGVIAFFVFLIYSLPLVLVYLTYNKFSSERSVYQPCAKF